MFDRAASILPLCARGRRSSPVVVAIIGLLAAGCSTTGRAPTDVGSMALPQPMAPGILSTTSVSSRQPDTGSMAMPRPMTSGVISTQGVTSRQPDTGNMAFPAPLPQGDLRNTRVQ